MSKQSTIIFERLQELTQRNIMFSTQKISKIEKKTVVKKGFRARKGQTTCKPETDKFILKMRRHWITSGTVF